jgi:hypothetical protein
VREVKFSLDRIQALALLLLESSRTIGNFDSGESTFICHQFLVQLVWLTFVPVKMLVEETVMMWHDTHYYWLLYLVRSRLQ